MTDQLRALAEAEANKLYPPNHTVNDPFGETGEAETDPYGYDEYANNAYVRGFIAGRTSAADEIEAERLDTDWEALGADAYINGLIKSEEIARKGRDV